MQTVLVAALVLQTVTARGTAIFGDVRVSLEVVADEASRQRGLMFRDRLGPLEGMVFVFPREGYYPFWMKNTLIPLDIFWLDAAGTILSIARAVPPCRADPCPSYAPTNGPAAVVNALYVVEVNAGFADRHNVRVGGRLTLQGVPARGEG